MSFEWHNPKEEKNLLKHGITFRMAANAFDDPNALFVEDTAHSIHERRQWVIGDSERGILVVVFTIRHPGRTIRIISARTASRKERRIYEENKRV